MKTLKLLFLVLLPSALLAVTYVAQWPDRLTVNGGVLFNPSPTQCRAAGYELSANKLPPTAEELAAIATAQSNAIIAQAAYVSSNATLADMSVVYPAGRGPVIMGADGFGYQPVPDPASGTWIMQKRTGNATNALAYRSDSVISGEIVTAIATNAAVIAAIRACKISQTNAIDLFTTIEPTNFPPGPQRQTIVLLRSTSLQQARALRDLETALLQAYRNDR